MSVRRRSAASPTLQVSDLGILRSNSCITLRTSPVAFTTNSSSSATAGAGAGALASFSYSYVTMAYGRIAPSLYTTTSSKFRGPSGVATPCTES